MCTLYSLAYGDTNYIMGTEFWFPNEFIDKTLVDWTKILHLNLSNSIAWDGIQLISSYSSHYHFYHVDF